MTDFYTVLCNALDRVGATQIDERDNVYAHVRDVMVRKLRNHRPPLIETEIANRINTFEAAIDRIEGEIADAAADRAELDQPTTGQPSYFGEQPANAPESNDWGRDEARSVAAWNSDVAAPEPMWGSTAIDMAWDELSEQWRDPSRPRRVMADRAPEPQWTPDPYEPAAENDDDSLVEETEPDIRRQPRRTRRAPQAEAFDLEEADAPETVRQPLVRVGAFPRLSRFLSRRNDRVDDDVDLEERRPPPPRRSQPQQQSTRSRRDRGDPIDNLARQLAINGQSGRAEPLLLGAPGEDADSGEARLYLPSPEQIAEEKPRRLRSGSRASKLAKAERAAAKPRRQRQRRQVDPEPYDEPDDEADFADADDRRDRRRRTLRLALLAFAALVIAWAAYVFVPILFPSAPETGSTVAETNAGGDPPAAEIGENIFLFRGEDPAIFESGSDNPVGYFGSESPGYVQIGSTITSGGARAIIGPGVAGRIAGHEIRVVMEVRGTPERPAATTRLGYQNGVAINDWRILRVPVEFGVVTATWTVPEGASNRGDYLLIEPGVPGDGNAIDIRAIWIEVID